MPEPHASHLEFTAVGPSGSGTAHAGTIDSWPSGQAQVMVL